MKLFKILTFALLSLGATNAQQSEIDLTTKYGSDNKEVHNLLRFQGVEVIDLKFSGTDLKGKN